MILREQPREVMLQEFRLPGMEDWTEWKIGR
jgi:hypothetical protein